MSSHFGPGCLAQHRRDIGSAADGIMGRRGPGPVLAFIGAERTDGALDEHQKLAVDRERMKPAADQRDIDARNQLAPERILGKKSEFKQVYSITI